MLLVRLDYRAQYRDDVPVFHRSVLVSLKEQLERDLPVVRIRGYDGTEKTYHRERRIPGEIEYTSVQELLTSIPKRFPIALTTPPLPDAIDLNVPRLTFDQAKESYSVAASAWRKSETCLALENYLATIRLPRITKIVCFGLGTLHLTEPIGALKRSQTQHAVIHTLKYHIRWKHPHRRVKVVCQDPRYREIDALVLESCNTFVVDDPSGFLEIDDTTLVYSVCPDVCVRQIVADMPRPAALFCNTAQPTTIRECEAERRYLQGRTDEYPQLLTEDPYARIVDDEVINLEAMTDPSSRRFRKMIEDYTAWNLPENNLFSEMTLYVRQ